MKNRTKFVAYFMGLFIVAASTAHLIADLVVSGFNYTGDVVLLNMVPVIIGQILMIAGIFLLKALTRKLLVFSMLLVSVITLALFIVKMLLNPDFVIEFAVGIAISAIAAVAMHVISARIGAYGVLGKFN